MAEAAAVVGALGVVALVLATSRRVLLAGLALIIAAAAGLALEGSEAEALASLGDSAAGVAALGAALLALIAAAAVLARWPLAIVPALLAVAPIRPPLATDPDSPVLLGLAGTGGLGRLYPLYGVLTAAVLALAWRALRGATPHQIPRPLAVPAAAFLGLVVLSLIWSEDERMATQDLLFFWLPFAVLFVVAAQAPFSARSPRLLAVTLVAIAGAFAAWGIWQAATEELLFFNVSLEQANELSSLFRVTAAFQDPNHLGRHLVLGLAVVLVAAWLARVSLGAALATIALLLAGLWFTFSQSSLVTLAVVALTVAVVAATGRARRLVVGATAVAVVAGAVAIGALLLTGASDEVTSDRSTLVSDTAAVALRHPVIGVGVSAQPRVTREQEAPDASKLQNVSHTSPLTVAAELGLIGLAAFGALLVGAARVLVDVGRHDKTLALGIGAVLLALLVHSLFYGGLFENPITWGALGVVAAATATVRAPSSEAGPAPTGRRAALGS